MTVSANLANGANGNLEAAADSTLTLEKFSSNAGTISVAGTGSTLNIGGTWSNNGTINTDSRTLNLGAVWDDTAGSLQLTGGTLNLGSTLSSASVSAPVLDTTAGSVAEALAVLPSIRPQVLISDIAMPHENGFDLSRQVRLGVQRQGPSRRRPDSLRATGGPARRDHGGLSGPCAKTGGPI
jgi:hypothetical protein